MPPVWMMACYAPMLLILFALRKNYRRSLHTSIIEEFMSVQLTAALAAMLLLGGMVLRMWTVTSARLSPRSGW